MVSIIADENNLPVWFHVVFDVDKELGLYGTPDYILHWKKEAE